MKGYTIFVLCSTLFVAAQCQRSKHSPDGPVYDGLNAILTEAREHAQMVAEDLTHRMNRTFNSIKEKVEQFKDNNAFTQEIESLKLEGDVIQECLKEHELGIATFMRKLVNTYDACSSEVKTEVNALIEKIKGHLQTIKDAPKETEKISKQCLKKDEKNAAASVMCVVTNIAEIQENIFAANQAVDKFIATSLEEVEDFATQKCDGLEELQKEFDSLFEKIETCYNKEKQ